MCMSQEKRDSTFLRRVRIARKKVARWLLSCMQGIQNGFNPSFITFVILCLVSWALVKILFYLIPTAIDESFYNACILCGVSMCACSLFVGKHRLAVVLNVIIIAILLICECTYIAKWIQYLGFSTSFLVVLSLTFAVVYAIKRIWDNTSAKKSASSDEKDWLFRGRFYARFHTCIRMQNADRGHAYALYGRWGSGKTHLLKYLDKRLRQKYLKVTYDDPNGDTEGVYTGSYQVCWIPLWHYSSIDEAWQAIINALLNVFTGRKIHISAPLITRFFKQVFGLVLSQQQVIVDAIQRLTLLGYTNSVEDDVASINKEVKKGGKRIVLIVEDLERCNVRLIEMLLPLIERLRKIQGLTIICAIDAAELERKCKKSAIITGNLQGYLDKVFDLSFNMPILPQSLAQHYFEQHVQNMHDECPFLLEFTHSANLKFHSPRQIEQVSNRLASLEKMYFPAEQHGPLDRSDEVFTVFYVDILRALYPMQYKELSDSNRRREVEKLKTHHSPYRQSKEELPAKLKKLDEKYCQDDLFNSIINSLDFSLSGAVNLTYAFSEKYARREYMTSWEIEDLIDNTHIPLERPLSQLIQKYFGKNHPEYLERASSSLLYACWKGGFEPLLQKEEKKRAFFASAIKQMPRDYNLPGNSDYFFLDWESPNLSFAYLETACAYYLTEKDNEIYKGILDILIEKVRLEHLMVLYSRLQYTSSPDFLIEKASFNMQVFALNKEKPLLQSFMRRLINKIGFRMGDYLDFHFSKNKGYPESIRDGYLEFFDKIQENIDWDGFKRGFSTYCAELTDEGKIRLFMCMLRSLSVKIGFPNFGIGFCAFSVRRLELFSELYTSVCKLLRTKHSLIINSASDILALIANSIHAMIGNEAPKRLLHLEKNGYRTATAQLFILLRQLQKLLKSI